MMVNLWFSIFYIVHNPFELQKMEYGIDVNNKFALFANEDEDPLEVLQRTQQEAAEKKAKNAAKENSKVAAKNDKNASKTAKPAAKPTAKVLTPAQDQKAKSAPATSTTQPPRRENVAGKCLLSSVIVQ